VLAPDGGEAFRAGFQAGADEVLQPAITSDVMRCRMDAVLARSDRDLGVHPSTDYQVRARSKEK
jgi:hypothetical protein